MDYDFDAILLEAKVRCGSYNIMNYRNGFSDLYPFTTENQNGYLESFDLRNKSLLTVGSSADQAINAALFKPESITVIDICGYTKFYFYLKVAAIITLNYNSFFKFFCYKDYSKCCKDNEDAFDPKVFKRIKFVLRLLDYESYLFWDNLFSSYSHLRIRRRLFTIDEYRTDILKKINPYLRDEIEYNKTKRIIWKCFPNFIIDDILKVDIDKNYDNIWLSNLGKYLTVNKLKQLVDKLYPHLNENGKMLVCYLYETTRDTKYKKHWEDIYDLDRFFKIFKEYDLDLVSFPGIKNINLDSSGINDSILLYKKRIKDRN